MDTLSSSKYNPLSSSKNAFSSSILFGTGGGGGGSSTSIQVIINQAITIIDTHDINWYPWLSLIPMIIMETHDYHDFQP